jgi:GT2 family glycosyltransferase
VQYFLEYCINSIYRSKVNFDFEIIVVDNASKDESMAMLQTNFPEVNIIQNKENVGFSKANNQGIAIAKGTYCLLLNPDTILQEDTLQKCIDTLEHDSKIGALGVKMLDGAGNFLPESKRGFPTLGVAFAKISGFAKLFPKSSFFGKYHLGYLDKDKNHEVDVLSGAFMMLRKDVLVNVGKLDETYFMYGEDIDLSYQIKQAGYKNMYLADTSIIHFKGESTKKGSLNYIKLFYGAMLIFAKKNLPKQQSKLLAPIIHLGIFTQAIWMYIKQIFNKILLPSIDIATIFSVLFLLKYVFENFIKQDERLTYPTSFVYFNMPLYTFFFIVSLYIFKVYHKSCTWKNIIIGLTAGFAMISIVYSFFPLSLRSSRAIILCSFLLNIPILILYRMLINFITPLVPNLFYASSKYLLVCNEAEIDTIKLAMRNNNKKAKFVGYINKNKQHTSNFLGTTKQITDIIQAYNISDIIFSTHTNEMKDIIAIMASTQQQDIHYRMYNDAQNIISSKNKNTRGEILHLNIDYNKPKNIVDRVLNWLD